jgi:hypothetical protein
MTVHVTIRTMQLVVRIAARECRTGFPASRRPGRGDAIGRSRGAVVACAELVGDRRPSGRHHGCGESTEVFNRAAWPFAAQPVRCGVGRSVKPVPHRRADTHETPETAGASSFRRSAGGGTSALILSQASRIAQV